MKLFKFFFPSFFRRFELLELIVSNTNTHNNKFREEIVENQHSLLEGLKRAHEMIAEQAVLLADAGLELKRMELTVTNIFDEQNADHERLVEHGKAINGLLNDTRVLKNSRKRGAKIRDGILDRILILEKARVGQVEINGTMKRKVEKLAAQIEVAEAPTKTIEVPKDVSVLSVRDMFGSYPSGYELSLHDVYQEVLLASDRARFSFQALVGKVQSMGVRFDGGHERKGRWIGLYNVNRLKGVFLALGVDHINPYHIAKDLAARK